MAEASVPSPDSPREVLASLGDLIRQVRTTQRAAWFPLLLLGVLLVAGIFIDHATFTAKPGVCPDFAPQGASCVRYEMGSPYYWLGGLAIVYGATALFYIQRSRRRGVGSLVLPYAIAGVVIAGAILPTRILTWPQPMTPHTVVEFLGLHLRATQDTVALLSRITGLAVSIGLPLLVLAWVERNRALLLFTLGFLVIELVPITFDAVTAPSWLGARQLAIPAVYLLIGAWSFSRGQRLRPRDVS